MNKRVLLLMAYTAILFVSAPTILGNAIITGKALVVYLVASILSLYVLDQYEKWKAAKSS